jgi:c-di-GMP-binding flagellar brake protein YcgR
MPIRPTRIQVNFKANYTLKNCEGEGHIVDISTGGIAMEVKQIFVVGDLVRIVFRLPDSNNDEIDFWGIVRSINGSMLGIRYEEISNENIEKLEHFVTDLILQAGRNARENFE